MFVTCSDWEQRGVQYKFGPMMKLGNDNQAFIRELIRSNIGEHSRVKSSQTNLKDKGAAAKIITLHLEKQISATNLIVFQNSYSMQEAGISS